MSGPAPHTRDFVEAYRTLSPSMLRLAYVLTGSKETAEDIVQDVFARSGHRLGSVDDPGPYLRRAVVNAVRSRHRRSIVAGRAMPKAAAVDAYLDDHELTDFRDALLCLGERQRAAIVLRYLYQLPDEEIAESIGCRRATVRSLIFRGLERLRQDLSGAENGPERGPR